MAACINGNKVTRDIQINKYLLCACSFTFGQQWNNSWNKER